MNDSPVIESETYPPTPEHYWLSTYQHRNGRMVTLKHGPLGDSDKQKAVIKLRGVVAGLWASVLYHEAFPGEEICANCVSLIDNVQFVDGERKSSFGRSSPEFHRHWGKLCPTCQQREAEMLKDRFIRELGRIGMTAEVTLKTIQPNDSKPTD